MHSCLAALCSARAGTDADIHVIVTNMPSVSELQTVLTDIPRVPLQGLSREYRHRSAER